MRNFFPSVIGELELHKPEATNGVCNRARETILHLQAWFSDKPVDTPWLESIGFKTVPGAYGCLRAIDLNDISLETYPHRIDQDAGERYWTYFGDPFHGGSRLRVPPRNRGEVLQLLRRCGYSLEVLNKHVEREAIELCSQSHKPS